MNVEIWNKKTPIFDGYLDPIYQTLDFCTVYYIADKGFAILNARPHYSPYQRMGIPEIQDVFVLPEARRQGIATILINYCETQVAGDMVGISVPVSPQYGAAQRLYWKLGYEPDGNGVAYEQNPVAHGSMARVDAQLCLMMVKELSPGSHQNP